MSTRRILLAIVAVIGLYYLAVGAVILRGRLSHSAHLLWQFPLNSPRDLVPDMLAEGTVCCGSFDGLFWVDSAGQEVAHVPVSSDESLVAWISQGDLTVLTGTESTAGQASVQAYDLRGRPLWKYELPGRTDGCWLLLSQDAVLVQRNGDELFKLSHAGELIWRNSLLTNSSFVSLAPDGRILATDQGGGLQVYDADFKIISQGQAAQQYLYIAGDTLPAYMPDGSCRIADEYSLSAVGKDGTVLWRHYSNSSSFQSVNPFAIWLQSLSLGRGYYSPSAWYGASLPAVAADGSSYYGTPDGMLYAIDAGGNEIWSKSLRGAVRGAVVGPDGTVYVAATESGVLAYSPQGKLLWRNSGLKPVSSAIALGTNGRLYVETDKALCCLEP